VIRFISSICAAAFLALLLNLGAAGAQGTAEVVPDFERWTEFADRTERIVDRGRGTDRTFQVLRRNIARYRNEFDAARNANVDRIAAVREQIAALGPAPEDGATPEAADVAAKRAELTNQLNALLVPVQRAEAEFVRADALVAQIDQAIRTRKAEQLRSVSPTPLNPVYWPAALADMTRALQEIWLEPSRRGVQRSITEWRETLPLALGFFLAGLVLITQGRRWAGLIVQNLAGLGLRGFGIWSFMASLLRVALPVAGIMSITFAVIRADVLGTQGNELLLLASAIFSILLGARWIAEQVFSQEITDALIPLPEDRRRAAHRQIAIVTLVIAAVELVIAVLPFGAPAAATEGVFVFPLFVVCGLALFRFGRILRGYTDPVKKDDDTEPRVTTFSRMVRWAGTGAIVVSILAPLVMAAGYYNAAQALMPPYAMTLGLLGVVMVLQRFGADVYGALTGRGVAAREALMPALFGLLLLCAALPALALVWGVSVTDLTELWAAFGRGFSIGEARISPTDFLVFALVFLIGYTVTRLIQSALRGNVLPKTKLDVGGQNAIVSGVGYVGILIAAIAAVSGAGLDLSSVAIVAGALSVGIGFGLQNIVSNFVSGIILLIERPISEGDWIEVGGKMGYVRNISVRSTRIETFDRSDVIVPNADLVSGTVTNYTRGNTVGRLIVPIGVAYGSDTQRIQEILQEIVEAQPMVLANPKPSVLFVNFGADALDFEIRCFLRDVNWMLSVKSNINHAIAARFAEEGIEIPYAQRDIWLRNPEVLRGDTES
jgi:small-conductance mechanosensitive channel